MKKKSKDDRIPHIKNDINQINIASQSRRHYREKSKGMRKKYELKELGITHFGFNRYNINT